MANGRTVTCIALPELPAEDLTPVRDENKVSLLVRVFPESCKKLRIN